MNSKYISGAEILETGLCSLPELALHCHIGEIIAYDKATYSPITPLGGGNDTPFIAPTGARGFNFYKLQEDWEFESIEEHEKHREIIAESMRKEIGDMLFIRDEISHILNINKDYQSITTNSAPIVAKFNEFIDFLSLMRKWKTLPHEEFFRIISILDNNKPILQLYSKLPCRADNADLCYLVPLNKDEIDFFKKDYQRYLVLGEPTKGIEEYEIPQGIEGVPRYFFLNHDIDKIEKEHPEYIGKFPNKSRKGLSRNDDIEQQNDFRKDYGFIDHILAMAENGKTREEIAAYLVKLKFPRTVVGALTAKEWAIVGDKALMKWSYDLCPAKRDKQI